MPKGLAILLGLSITVSSTAALASQHGDMFSDHSLETPARAARYPEAGTDMFRAPPESNQAGYGSDMLHSLHPAAESDPQDMFSSHMHGVPNDQLYYWPKDPSQP